MSVQVLRRRFTVDEYHRMAEAGIFYAQAAIQEVWLVDLQAPQAFPEVHLEVDEILGD